MSTVEFIAIRKTLGLTQKQLGEKLGCQANTISRMETGELPIVDAKAKSLMNLLTIAVLSL